MTTATETTNQPNLADSAAPNQPGQVSPAEFLRSDIQPLDEVQAAEQRLNKLESQRERADGEIARKQKLAQQLDREIAAAQKARSKARSEIVGAKEEKRFAEARRPQSAVTYKIALGIAEGLIEAASVYRENPKQLKETDLNDNLWESIDSARTRLLTEEINEDCRLIVVAVERVIRIADNWERSRLDSGFKGSVSGYSIGENSRFKKAVTELQSILNDEPVPTMSAIGLLVTQDLGLDGIARTLDLVLVDGKPDLHSLADLIDSRCEVRPSWACIRSWGVTDVGAAWARRQADVERRQRIPFKNPGSSAHGASRPGRTLS